MDKLKLSENIVKWRQAKHMTQEMLADYMGVTKSSVSKWERGVTVPDVVLLPLLASYFDVSIDTLMGYEPQLSKDQIKRYYFDFASAFAHESFESVIQSCQKAVKKYYACYPFLLQMSILWLNHLNLAPNKESMQMMIASICQWCERIELARLDPMMIENARVVKATAQLMNQEFDAVIDTFEDRMDVNIIGNKDHLLVMAYLENGQANKAELTTQVAIYRGLTQLIGSSVLLFLNPDLPKQTAEMTIQRIDGIIDLYQILKLNPNLLAQYHFRVALYYANQNPKEPEETQRRLRAYIEAINKLLSDELVIHGDSYFTVIDEWIEELSLGIRSVRNKNLVIDSAIQGLMHPAFNDFQKSAVIQKTIHEWEALKC